MKNCINIIGPKIYTEKTTIEKGIISIIDGKISNITSINDKNNKKTTNNSKNNLVEQYSFPKDTFIIPGIIDIHMHGLYGFDIMDKNEDALFNICKILPKEGITSFLATTVTDNNINIESTLKRIKCFKQNEHAGANLLGVNLEGPFISREKAGIHNKDLIQNPNIDLIERWQKISGNNIKIVTIAPELKGSIAFIDYLSKNKIIPSIGHTNCTYLQADNAIKNGALLATHLFNAMSGIHHRHPGAVLSILDNNKICAELIVDGYHLCEEIIRFSYKILKKNRIILVSDSIGAKGLQSGLYNFHGNTVKIDGKKAVSREGILAGSLLYMNEGLKNMKKFTGAKIGELIDISSANQARLLNIYDKKGSIAIGKDADLVVLNKEFDVLMTVCMGKVAYINNNVVSK
ncbi:MAG: N-acetylglucosamine-6-phosphate deacetylase [Deferribacterota bacterium]|nr:N-acetylglucosamine-6-phosphate deacetylase [Deferribacterota bacterium]